MSMMSRLPRWAVFTGALLVPTLAFAAANAPSGWCPIGALFGCCP